LEKLKEVVKQELINIPDKFGVKLIQLYFDDNDGDKYTYIKTEDITDKVAI